MVRISGNIEKLISLTEIQYKDTTEMDNLKIDSNIKSWIRFTTKDSKIIIKYLVSINSETNIITLDSKLPDAVQFIDKFEVDNDINWTHKKNKKLKVAEGSTTTTIKLKDADKNEDKIYNNYFVYYSNQVIMVKEYLNNILTLEVELNKAPVAEDEIILMPHFFNDYIIFGIDFTDFLGMDFSDFIKSIGGSMNFQLSSSTSVICCLLFCSISIILLLLMMSRKSTPKPQVPIVIQSTPPPPPPSAELKREVISSLLPYINPLYNKWQPEIK
jgi:hypothetical protein